MEFIQRLINALTNLQPLHPMMVHFPIALTGAALFFILLSLLRRSKLFEQVAFSNLALASVSTVVAGITGMRDNVLNYQGTAPNASLKIILAVILLILTAVTVFVRWRNPDLFWKPSSRWLYAIVYLISFGLAATLGFLGGVILYGF
jgi:uncharacterized membrane protein